MRHAQSLKDTVRQLRSTGLSLGQIYTQTLVPRTTIRTWISDIELSEEQLNNLKNRVQNALQAGRIRAQKIQGDKRRKKAQEFKLTGEKEIGELSTREFFLTGVALYWAEGFKNKHEHRLGFCNSDPSMIKFYIKWLETCLKVKKTDIVARLTLNQSYKTRVEEFQRYWSHIAGIPLNQFTKSFYQNTQWKKNYNSDNYRDVLRIHAKGSLSGLLRMRGWIEGLRSIC